MQRAGPLTRDVPLPDLIRDHQQTLVKGGRARWKIENECFNTLKNQGYCIDHSYGHGDKNLCFNFYLLTLIVVPEYFDEQFIRTRTFWWKVSLLTLVSCLPLIIGKYVRRRFAPTSHSKLT